MAKLSMINREAKRLATVQKYAAKRVELKARMKDESLTAEERDAARSAYMAMPRDASPCRIRNRCRVTGRSRGVYRKFGLGRNKLREAAMRGDIPCLVKASW